MTKPGKEYPDRLTDNHLARFNCDAILQCLDGFAELYKILKPVEEDEFHRYFASVLKTNLINTPQKEHISDLVNIIKLGMIGDKKTKKKLQKLHTPDVIRSGVALIIAGDSKENSKTINNQFKDYIRSTLIDFQGEVISGGTKTGVPGLAGRITKNIRRNHKKTYKLIGYLPVESPSGIEKDESYDDFVLSPSNDFSYLEVMKYWVDILFAEPLSDNITLLGFGGGKISEVEYKMALLLGAEVRLAKDSGRAADKILIDERWGRMTNLKIIYNTP